MPQGALEYFGRGSRLPHLAKSREIWGTLRFVTHGEIRIGESPKYHRQRWIFCLSLCSLRIIAFTTVLDHTSLEIFGYHRRGA
jgi:hypothetical protein